MLPSSGIYNMFKHPVFPDKFDAENFLPWK
jgi:hypothetical protein